MEGQWKRSISGYNPKVEPVEASKTLCKVSENQGVKNMLPYGVVTKL